MANPSPSAPNLTVGTITGGYEILAVIDAAKGEYVTRQTSTAAGSFNGLQRVASYTPATTLTVTSAAFSAAQNLGVTLQDGDLIEVGITGSGSQTYTTWAKAAAGKDGLSTSGNTTYGATIRFPNPLTSSITLAGVSASITTVNFIKVWRDAANGYVLPTATTLAVQSTATLSAGNTFVGGGTTTTFIENYGTYYAQIAVPAGKVLTAVTPATVTIQEGLTGKISITAPSGTGNITITPTFSNTAEKQIGYWRLTADLPFTTANQASGARLAGNWASEAGFTNTITQNGTAPSFWLEAGRTYEALANLYFTGMAANTYVFANWTTGAGTAIPASSMGGAQYTAASAETMGAEIRAFIKPTTSGYYQITVHTNSASAATLSAEGGNRSTSIFIKEILPNTPSVVPEGTIAYTPRIISGAAAVSGASVTSTTGRDLTDTSVEISPIPAGMELATVSAPTGDVLITDTGRGGIGRVLAAPDGEAMVITFTLRTWRRALTATNSSGGAAVNVNGAASISVDATKPVVCTVAVPANNTLTAVTITGGTLNSFSPSGEVSIMPSNTAAIAITCTFANPSAKARVRAHTGPNAIAFNSTGPGALLNGWTETQDTDNAFDGATFTAPRDGYYMTTFQVMCVSSTMAAGGRCGIVQSINGVGWGVNAPINTFYAMSANPANFFISGSEVKFLTAGQTLTLRGFLDSATAVTTANNPNFNFWHIAEL